MKKQRTLMVSTDLFEAWLKGRLFEGVPVENPIPDDATIVGARLVGDVSCGIKCVELVLESDSFDSIKAGAYPPPLATPGYRARLYRLDALSSCACERN